MGLFDSLTGQPEIDGTAAVAAALRAPVVLVVDVAAMGHSLAALVHGFRMFDEMVHLGGVILNRVASPRHEQMLRTALDDIGMPVLGALRRGDLPDVLPARAHGPVPVAHRTVEAGPRRTPARRGGRAARSTWTGMMALAGVGAGRCPGPVWTPGRGGRRRAPVRRAASGDRAGRWAGRALHVRGDGRAAHRGRRRRRGGRPAARRGAAGRHARADRRRRPARGVRGGALRQPPPVRRRRAVRPRRLAGHRRGRRPALAGPRLRRPPDVRRCWTPRR